MKQNQDSITTNSLKRQDLTSTIITLQADMKSEQDKVKLLESEYATHTSKISELTQDAGKASEKIKEYTSKLDEGIKAEQDLIAAEKDRADKLDAAQMEESNTRLSVWSKGMKSVAGTLGKVGKGLDDLVQSIYKMQRQFGISAGAAAKLKFENLVNSLKTYGDAFTGKGPAVSAEDIAKTQESFQSEFGGVLTSKAATDMAQEAQRLGVGASEMAKARRVFMTQTMGDTGKAKAAQDQFIGEFTKKGLTAKDAMEAIGKNTELLARNGARFATSFARAAADAKKIGVDLGKIDQVGDNIIGDFEGFLEKQAELGAMGFGFDTQRLAQTAETGDTGALFEELRSQLASTGKDITKLKRSEQLALSQAFGISMEEMQRMAGPKGKEGSGEKTLSPEEVAKDSNKLLGQLVFIAQGIAKSLIVISGLLMFMSSDFGSSLSKLLTKGGRRALGRMGRSVMRSGGRLLRSAGRGVSRFTGGIGRGISGLGSRIAGGVSRLAGGGGGLGSKIAGGAGKLLSKVGGLGKIAKFGGRLLGKAALPLTLAMSAFDAFKGFNADKNASFGGKLKNAGSSVLNGLTFGLLGKDSSQIAEEAKNKQASKAQTAATPASQAPTAQSTPTAKTPTAPSAAATTTGGVAAALAASGIGGTGTTTPSETKPASSALNIDFTRLEQKLDQVVKAIGSMEVKMDGNKVGKVIVASDQKAATSGVFRAQRI